MNIHVSLLACAFALPLGCTLELDQPMEHTSDGKADDPTADPTGDDTGPGLVAALDASHHTRTITDPEVDCFWDLGYRHLIAGTQIPAVTRAQLEVAVRGGMTVDLYVYLYWHTSVEKQVQVAVELAQEFPQIGTIWLDLEEAPGGRSSGELVALTQRAIETADGIPVGIYTGKGFWDTAMDDTTVFAELPLWYARYDNVASLDTYEPGGEHAFGGWTEVAGKQWDDHIPGVCGRAVDKNLMWIDVEPEVVVDRSPLADDGDAPGLVEGLWPDDGLRVPTNYVRPTAPSSREATRYVIELQYWRNGAFHPYVTKKPDESAATLFPVIQNAAYRWRIRAVNQHGEGPWSAWAWFEFGVATALPQSSDIQSP